MKDVQEQLLIHFFLFQYFPSNSDSGFQGMLMKLGRSEVPDIENTLLEYLQNDSDSSVSKIFHQMSVSQYVVFFLLKVMFEIMYGLMIDIAFFSGSMSMLRKRVSQTNSVFVLSESSASYLGRKVRLKTFEC